MGLAWDGYQPHFFILSIIFPILATIAVALRFHSRRLARQDLAADDWLILAALVIVHWTAFLSAELTMSDILLWMVCEHRHR